MSCTLLSGANVLQRLVLLTWPNQLNREDIEHNSWPIRGKTHTHTMSVDEEGLDDQWKEQRYFSLYDMYNDLPRSQ